MHVIEFIKQHGLDALNTELGINIKRYPDSDIVLLDYSQFNSPKNHPVVCECRGLILSLAEEITVVCRSFDRFFNFGESGCDLTHASTGHIFREKRDGSLIRVYNHDGKWHISTRGMAFAEGSIAGTITFSELVRRTIMEQTGRVGPIMSMEEFSSICDEHLCEQVTYCFELNTPENRVITHYAYAALHLLGIRHRSGGYWDDPYEVEAVYNAFGSVPVQTFTFNTVADAVEAAGALKDRTEGYVVYDTVSGAPVGKIKSPFYCQLHHIKGEGLTPKSTTMLIHNGEIDEYLAYFPMDSGYVEPFRVAYSSILERATALHESYMHIEDQRDFAVSLQKDHRCDKVMLALVFDMRNNKRSAIQAMQNKLNSFVVEAVTGVVKK